MGKSTVALRVGDWLRAVEGGVYGPQQHRWLTESLSTNERHTIITLLASAKTVLERAQADPSPDRVVSKIPDVQRLLYAEFEGVLPFLNQRGLVLSAEDTSPEDLAQAIGELILELRSGRRPAFHTKPPRKPDRH
ncbi:MAG: hypothetical protein AB7Q29_12000 [Vicinamibacterales bacterium]